MRISNMAKTAWRIGDKVKITVVDGHWVRVESRSFSTERARLRSQWVKDGERTIENGCIMELVPNCVSVQDELNGTWWEFRDFQIVSIEPITMKAWG